MKDSIFTDAVTLWVVLDPIATVPLFLSVTQQETAESRRRIAARATVIAAAILIAFIILGQIVLKALGISLPSFQIAGGLVLFAVGMKMIFAPAEPNNPVRVSEERGSADVAVFPVAMPFIAGPASIMAVVLLTDSDRFNITEQVMTAGVMLAILAIDYVVFRSADKVQRLLGETGINVLSRVMGLVLTSLAVETVISGVRQVITARP